MGHHLGLATRMQISVYKSPFPSAVTAMSLFRAKTLQYRPLLLREFKTRLPDYGDSVCEKFGWCWEDIRRRSRIPDGDRPISLPH